MSPLLSWRTRVVAVVLAAAATAGGLLWAAEPARAHDQLIGSTPAAGEELTEPPGEVVLQFSDDLLELGAAVLVVDAAERSWTAGDVVYAGSRVTIALGDGMPDGAYEIRWRVVSGDGHPISGIVPFTVGDVADPSAASQASPTASATASATADGRDGAADGSAAQDPGAMRIVLVGLVGAVVAGGGYALAGLLRRRRGTHRDTDEPGSS